MIISIAIISLFLFYSIIMTIAFRKQYKKVTNLMIENIKIQSKRSVKKTGLSDEEMAKWEATRYLPELMEEFTEQKKSLDKMKK